MWGNNNQWFNDESIECHIVETQPTMLEDNVPFLTMKWRHLFPIENDGVNTDSMREQEEEEICRLYAWKKGRMNPHTMDHRSFYLSSTWGKWTASDGESGRMSPVVVERVESWIVCMHWWGSSFLPSCESTHWWSVHVGKDWQSCHTPLSSNNCHN